MNIPSTISNSNALLELWNLTVSDLETTGYMSNLDAKTLERYVIVSVGIKQIEEQITIETNGTGFIVNSKTGLSEMHPLTRPLNEKQRILLPLIEQLGLSPKSRRFLIKNKPEEVTKDDDSQGEFDFLSN
ncbi:P27 family phage terminase small subunit [Gluconacetobacter diazotrophicus]|uniref:P27 family phage terminase small subunit n=1 Tax=Gluconacetobacter diazotrophicus TaxID=33996 RepID=UPI0011A6F827|nr:P27 family phage terminase small subunit [Gluconacetobacter diazotrophicus]